MKNVYLHKKKSIVWVLMLLSVIFFNTKTATAQNLIDTLNWSTNRFPLLATGQNYLYLGDENYVGKSNGNNAFFLNGSSQPAKGMPDFSAGYSNCNERAVLAAVQDGNGGWYVGGNFAAANGEKTGPLAHILPGKSIEQQFINGLSFSPNGLQTVYALKKDGNFLYVGGEFSATNNSGNTYKSLFRVNLTTKTVDPSFNPISIENQYVSPRINHIEVSADKVFVSGASLTDDNDVHFLVFDKRTGKRISAPSAGISTIKLLGNDTLLYSAYSATGYPAQKLAILDTTSDTSLIKNRSIVLGNPFIASVADGKGGWYVANDKGIFHYDKEFQKDPDFSQNKLTYWYYLLTKQLVLSGNNLFVVYDGQKTVNGKTISQVFKLDARTGAIDTSFSLQPDGKVYTLAAKGDTLFVSGTFNNIAGNAQSRLAAVSCSTGKFIDWHPKINSCTGSGGDIFSLLIHNNLLYVGGKFKISGTPAMASVARFDLKTGKADTSFHFYTLLQNCNTTTVTGMALYDNKLFLTGYFSLDLSNVQINNLVYINLDDKTIHPVSRSYTASIPGGSGGSPKLTEYNGKIYCQGLSVTDTTTLLSREYFFAFDANSGNLTQWNPNPDDQVLTFSVSEGRFLISGYFNVLKTLFINNEISNSLAAFDTHTLQYIPIHQHGKILTGSINSFAYNGKYIFADCNSLTYGDSTINGILRLNRKDLSFSSFHPHIVTGTNPSQIYKIALNTNNILYVLASGDNGYREVRLVDAETGELKNWSYSLNHFDIDRMIVTGNDLILPSYYGLWPTYKRQGLARIDLSTGKLSDWAPEFTLPNGYEGIPTLMQMKISGDTVFTLFRNPAVLNGLDTGNLFLVDGVTGQIIPGFKSPRFPSSGEWGIGVYPGQTFAVTGSSIFIGGDFTEVNGEPHYHLVKIDRKTGLPQQWPSPFISNNGNDGQVYSVLAFKDTLYVGGEDMSIKNDSAYYDLVSLDTKTGKVIHKYPVFKKNDMYNNAKKLTVNHAGDIVMFRQLYSTNKVYILPHQNRDTLIELTKVENAGRNFMDVKTANNYFIFAAKQVKERGQLTEKPGFIVYDPQNDTVFRSFSFPVTQNNDGISSFAFTDKILAVGGDFCGVYGHLKIKNLTFLTMPDLHLKPGVTSWSPHKADNRNPFALHIYGSGFSDSSAVYLISKDTTLSPDSMFVTSNRIIAWYDGRRFVVGDWDLKVDISQGLSKTFAKAVHINQGSHADLWAKFIGPSTVYIHKPESFYIKLGNKGTSGAFGVFLYIAVGEHQTLLFPKNIETPDIHFKHFNIDLDTVGQSVNVDYFFGEPFHGKVYTLFLPYVPAHFDYALKVYIRSDLHGETPEMRVAISQPLYESYNEMSENLKSTNGWFSNFLHCAYDVASVVVELTPGLGCAKSVYDNFISNGYYKKLAERKLKMLKFGKAAGLITLDCSGLGEVGKAYKVATKIVQVGTGVQSFSSSCSKFFGHLHGNTAQTSVHTSVDPNDKFGPTGVLSSHFVTSDQPYTYMITFENDSAATAAAERVIITDTLDKNVFDLTSFKPIGFGFGDTTYLYKEDDGDTVYIDLRPAKNTIVRVFYHLDQNSGRLTCTFQALDPNTYDYVTNVNDGFLPPNKKAPEGDGNILYSIMPLSGLADGTEIRNTAHIVFDWNADIPTKAWVNQTDDTPPESAVNALPDKEVNKDFTVSWSGSDDGSGIYAYTVFVSENDSTYYPWITDTHDTSAVFSGQPGVTYKFYSVATDSAGNVEAAPGIYDAITWVSGTGIETFGVGNQLQFRLYPNPVKGKLHMDAYLPQSGKVRIDILNLCGHLVMDPIESSGTQGILKNNVDLSRLPAGTYFVRISTRFGSQIRKVVVR
jgi:uncharacterized repeat protein (TIGR01451 family)